MTAWIGFSSVCADIVILLALAAAARSPRLSRAARPVLAAFAFTCAWLVAAVADAVRAPGWTIFMSGAIVVTSVFVITASVHLWTQGANAGEIRPGHRALP